MTTSARRFIRYALAIQALELLPEGRELKSGRISPYFFNAGLFKTGRSLAELASAYAEIVMEKYPHALSMPVLFGPAYKGIPLVSTLAMRLWDPYGLEAEIAFNRKETKKHGEGGVVVGASLEGRKVLIVDDVITAGDAKKEAIEIIHAHGGTPCGCVIAFDRQEREREGDQSAVQEFESKYGIPMYAASTLCDLIAELETNPPDGESDGMLNKILAYKEQYGV